MPYAGVCVPGISWSGTGRVWAPNIPGWDDYPLRDELLGLLGPDGPQLSVDSDRACAVLGEAWLGAARGCTDAVFITVGTGIGAGILVNGAVLRGAQDIAGATGWMALDRPFRADYARWGCFEHQASGDGLARRARELRARYADYAGPLRTDGVLRAREIFAAHSAGDPLALEVIQNAVECWGMAAANFVSLFNPEVVIFGGGVFGPALQLLPDIAREAQRWAQPLAMERVRIVGSALGGDAALYGAASLALRSLIRSGGPRP